MADEPVVPGEFKCPQCGFVVLKSILSATSGACWRDSKDVLEPCPNDGTILRPVLMIDALNEARGEACKMARKIRIAEQMECLLHNLVNRGSIGGHEFKAAESVLQSWKEAKVTNEY